MFVIIKKSFNILKTPTFKSYNIPFNMYSKTNFNPVAERPEFPQEEEAVLKFWERIKAFETSLEKSKGKKTYTFYDGPPFATGLPHYGHITAGTIKDVVTRYASQTGHYVERRFGWDCHGLPVEHEIDKAHNIKSKSDYYQMGIDKYNAECKKIVMRYSSEWRSIITRFGRWIDFDNDYKTMDLKFMESVWSVFKKIHERGLVYRGCKIMPYSNACNTVLSNFEAGLNYQDVDDPSVHITFPLLDKPEEKFVAWTTTPWTLPSNLALAVNPEFIYLKVKDVKKGEIYIVAECRINDLYKKKEDYIIIEKLKGKDLENIQYVPLFPDFASLRSAGCFKVLCGDFVTKDSGTGIVHCAPAHGEEDYRICRKYNIIDPANPLCLLDDNGKFTNSFPFCEGIYLKDADKKIKQELKAKGRLILEGTYRHSYPFCWRSDTPLIYKAHHSWFFKVTDLREELLKNNSKAYWVPSWAQEHRFHNWLESAQDWCFSRNRCWGNPIPIWASDDYEEIVVVGSIEELKKLTGAENITDLHRDYIDHLTIPSQKGKGVLKRVEEVFDCWFESGSMPFAQRHYPFSVGEEEFNKGFPADFIGEGIDQTRGWFYTLNVVSTALGKENPYKNLIVNGLVLAADGKKMSKRLKNYTDPVIIANTYGADAVRLYLMNSLLVQAGNLNFKDEGVKSVVKDIFLPWYHAYRFLIQNVSRWEIQHEKKFVYNEGLFEQEGALNNFMDRWIIAANQNLIKFFREEMEKYRLYTVVPKLVKFLEELTNWYVRLNRNRIKGELGEEERITALNVLFEVLLKQNILFSPFTPFLTDMMYANLTKIIDEKSKYREESIHFLSIPEFNPKLLNENIEKAVSNMQRVIELARMLREKKQVSFKQPITSIKIITKNTEFIKSLDPLLKYIKEDVNTPLIEFDTNIDRFVQYTCTPNSVELGKRLKNKFNKDFIAKVKAISEEQIQYYMKNKTLKLDDIDILDGELKVEEKYNSEGLEQYHAFGSETDFCLIMDLRQDEKLRDVGIAREVINKIQKLRKKAKLVVEDDIFIFFHAGKDSLIQGAINREIKLIDQIVKKPFLNSEWRGSHFVGIAKEENEHEKEKFAIELCYPGVLLNTEALNADFGKASRDVQLILTDLHYKDLVQRVKSSDGKISFRLNDSNFEVVHKKHFFLNSSEI